MLVVLRLFFLNQKIKRAVCLFSQEKRQNFFEFEHNNVVRIFAHFSKQQCYSHMMRKTESGAACAPLSSTTVRS